MQIQRISSGAHYQQRQCPDDPSVFPTLLLLDVLEGPANHDGMIAGVLIIGLGEVVLRPTGQITFHIRPSADLNSNRRPPTAELQDHGRLYGRTLDFMVVDKKTVGALQVFDPPAA